MDGCCVDSEWWAPTLPQHAFLRNGLVHMTRRWDPTESYCGAPAVPYGIQLFSTDAARAYALQLAEELTDVTCFFCISYEAIVAADVWP